MYDQVNAKARTADGRTLYPHMYGQVDGNKDAEVGWYDFTPQPFAPGALDLYYWITGRSTARRSTCCPRNRAGSPTSTAKTSSIRWRRCKPTTSE